MKKIITILYALTLLVGCTSTNVTTDTWSMKRTSFLQKLDIPKVTIRADGTASLEGYSTDGGNAALGTIVEAAVTAGVKAAKP